MPDWHAIAKQLEQHGIDPAAVTSPRPVRGGDINAAWRIEAGDAPMFVKTAAAAAADMFSAEADGLRELASADAVRVPRVYATGSVGSDAYIALEWLDFEAATSAHEQQLGRQLAAMHRHTEKRYGWHRDNTIGRTPQINTRSDDWIAFFREQRLRYQLDLARRNGHSGELQSLGAKLDDGLHTFFADYLPVPSLLHGDLWGGNWAVAGGTPVIFDPAVYYGDRESDIAMTRLFGGFGTAFYDAYEDAWPLADGADARQELYQLYHVLNHLNLFGGGYLGSALKGLRSLCARL